jgi:hypothetical protein
MGAGEQGADRGGRSRGGMEDELAGVPTLAEIARHPMDDLLRTERLPHIWCPGCGLGTALSCFTSALMRSHDAWTGDSLRHGAQAGER